MSAPVASVTDAISYDDLYARWERGNWRATEIDFSQDARRLARAPHRRSSGARRCGSTRSSSTARTRSPTTSRRTSTPRRWRSRSTSWPPSRSTRRATAVFFKRFMHEVVGAGDGTMAGGLRATPARSRGATARSSAAWTGWPTSCARPLQAQAGRGGDALPRRRRGLAGPAGPAHDRGLRSRSSTCCPASARACATSRSTSSATSASASSCWPTSTARTPGRSRTHRRPHQGGPAVDLGGGQAAELGPLLHRVLRLHARGPRRGRRDLDRAEACARSGCRSTRSPASRCRWTLPPRERAVRGQKLLRAGLIGPGDDGVPRTLRRSRSCSTRSAAGDRRRRAPGHDDRVGLRRRRALARRAGQRRLAGGGGPRPPSPMSPCACASPTGRMSWAGRATAGR